VKALRKRFLKILYFTFNGIITLIMMIYSKGHVHVTDNHFIIKVLIVLIIGLLFYALNHYVFMKAIFGKSSEQL
jgi:hypothetical protein